MPRQRFERGSVSKSNTKPQKWLGEWHVYRKVDGKEKRVHRGPKVLGLVSLMSKSDARDKLAAIIQEERSFSDQRNGEEIPTFAQIYKEYVELKKPSWSASSLRSVKWIVPSHILPVIGSLPCDKVTRPALQGLLNSLAEKDLSYSLITKARVYLKAIFDEAIENERIVKNPARLLTIPNTKDEDSRALTAQEATTLLDSLTGRDHLIVRLLLVGGFRPCELFMLKRNDRFVGGIRVDEGVVRGVIGGTKTRASKALVALPPLAELELDSWLAANPGGKDDLIFASENGTPIEENNYRNRVLQPAAIAAKVGVYIKLDPEGKEVEATEVNFQVLRRTCATLFQKHGSVKDAQTQMRHASPVTTLTHYQQAIPESVMAAVTAMDAMLCGSGKATIQ